MSLDANVILWIIGLIALGLAAYTLFRWVNPDQLEMRKRRKNYGKVVTRARRPMVMLNVDTDKR